MTIRIIAALAAILTATPSLAVDLMDIYSQAQVNDARYAVAKAQYLAQQERLPQARAGLLPDINFEAGYNYNDIDVQYDQPTFNSGRRDYNAYNYGINLSQPLYRRQNMIGVDQAYIQIAQAATELDLASQDLVLRSAQAYFDILLARFNLSTVRSQKTAVREQLEQAKRNFVVGSRTIRVGLRHLVDRKDRRDLSIFQIGLRFIERKLIGSLPISVLLCVRS